MHGHCLAASQVLCDALEASEIVQQVSLASKKILQKPLVFGTLGNSDAIEDYYQEITSNWDVPTGIWTGFLILVNCKTLQPPSGLTA